MLKSIKKETICEYLQYYNYFCRTKEGQTATSFRISKNINLICPPIKKIQNMQNKINPEAAPYNYARCFNNQCPKADNCLHRMAALNDTNEYPFIKSVNPQCFPVDGRACPYFQSAQKIHVAWGIKHLLDEVPYKDVFELKHRMLGYFGRGKYYHFYREECFLTPEDQNYIRQLFLQKGITKEPVFENYSDEYRW